MAKKKRSLKSTLLIVGEGEAEQAFLFHLRSLYGKGNPKVTIKSAGGKGPNHVLTEAISTKEASGYDSAGVLMDTDKQWPQAVIKKARAKKVTLIPQNPCLEGLLLDILGMRHPNPPTNKGYKSLVHPMLRGRETCKHSYSDLFTKEVLDKSRVTCQELDNLISLIEGKINK